MTIQRLPNWRELLHAYVVETAREPFRIGKNDCALWVAGAVKVMTGKDFARGFRGYRTFAEGKAKLNAAGYEDHIALVAANFEEVPPAFAQAGDITVVEQDALSMVQGEVIYVPAPSGRGYLPLIDAKRAFRV